MPGTEPEPPYDARRRAEVTGFGLKVFLAGLSALFAATIIGYLIVMLGGSGTEFGPGERVSYEEARAWSEGVGGARSPSVAVPPTRMSGTVWAGLAGATAILLASSATIALALRAVRAGAQHRFRVLLGATLVLGLGFLAVQAVNWTQLAGELPLEAGKLRTATFYLLTGTHAAHVIGGLIPLATTVSRARAGRYGADNWVGVRNVAWYWHFLDVVWLLMLAAMLVVGH